MKRRDWWMLAWLPAVACAADVPADRGRELYTQLAFEACVPLLAQPAEAAESRLRAAGVQLGATLPDERIGKFLKLPAGEGVTLVASPVREEALAVQAYVGSSRHQCAVLGSLADDSQAPLRARLADPEGPWVLFAAGGAASVYLATIEGVHLMATVQPPAPGKVATVRFEVTDLAPPARLDAPAVDAWLEALLAPCIDAARARRAAQPAQFAAGFEARPDGKDGRVLLHGREGAPSGMLFAGDDKVRTCSFVGSGGKAQTDQVVAAVERALRVRGATPTRRPRDLDATRMLLPRPADAPRGTADVVVSYGRLLDLGAMFIVWSD